MSGLRAEIRTFLMNNILASYANEQTKFTDAQKKGL